MCDTLVRVGPDGVLFGKNSDRDADEPQLLDWQMRRRHPPGAMLRCTWIEIPQVAETYAVLLSRPFWMWGAEMGANEHGVVIGNEAVFTHEPYATVGLTGMDLLRLGLERAETAERAVQVMVSLLERHGQGGSCAAGRRFLYHNSFLVADAGGAFVLETAGRHFAVERVQGARSISNGLTIPGFAEAHQDRLRGRVGECRRRRARTEEAAGRARGPGDLMAALRDHGGVPWPRYRWLNGAMGAPCMHAGGLLAAAQTTASWVSWLRPGDAAHWATATAAPCVSLFKPVRVDEPLHLGPAPGPRPESPPRSLWWRHERLHRRVLRAPARLAPLFLPERDRVERAWLADPPPPPAALAEAERLLARWTEQVLARPATSDERPLPARLHWARRLDP